MTAFHLRFIKCLSKPWFAAAVFGVFATFGAHADNPVTGATLYANNCSGCHGSTPLTSNKSKIYYGRNARAVIEAAIAGNNSGMGSLRSTFPTNGSQIADVAAYLGNTPSTLTFGTTNVGTTSATTQTVTVSASLKGASYAISGLSVATTGDFARSGGTCGTTVATGTSCTVIVAFSPTASGTRTGTLSITHNNTLTPVAIALSGTATGGTSAPVASISPTSLTLASTAIGSTSAAQNVNVSNTGNAALSISALTLSNTADFVVAGGTCAAGGSVAAGSSCTVAIAFKPAAGTVGTRSGTLSIAHNATGTPGSVSLSGSATAAAAPVASLTSALSFGSLNVGSTSAAQTATLSNTGTAPLTIGTLSTGSAEFTISGGTCAAGGTVAAASSCSVNISFKPSAAGARSASLVVTHNASGGQSSSSLAGTGVALAPVISLSPTTLSFSQTTNTTSAAQTVTVSNTGSAALVIGTIALGGAQASEFQLASGGTCVAGGSVAANGSCSLKLTFTPTSTGARSATLTITHNATGSPSTITLNGSGTATAQPAISLNASTLSFSSQTIATTSANQTVTVTNSGSATLTLASFTLTGTAAGDFTRTGTCAAAASLAAGATCTMSFSFTPGAIGARSATLTLASDASNGSAVLSLSGTGAAVPTPAVAFAPGSLAFGNQALGVASTARAATLSNTGSGALNISGITASAGFGVTHNCGTSVAAGASCTLSVVFTPSALGSATGSVNVASNAAGSPQSLSLSGSGVAASPVLAWSPATTAIAFGDAGVGGTPPSQSLTLTNQGPGAVTLQQFTIAGAQAADFSLGSTGTCVANVSLPQGSSCSLALEFQPGAAGARSATLSVASSGTNPPDVALSGNGTALAQAAINVVPGAITFTVNSNAASVDPQTLSLENTGNAVLHVSAVRIASGSFTLEPAAVNGCAVAPFDLLPGQACSLLVGWSGTAADSQSGVVEIDSTAASTPMQVALQAVPATGAAADATTISNVGGGGCSIASGRSLADPMLWLLVALAAIVLWRRRGPR
jgi:trimeric autotransporter adhesin